MKACPLGPGASSPPTFLAREATLPPPQAGTGRPPHSTAWPEARNIPGMKGTGTQVGMEVGSRPGRVGRRKGRALSEQAEGHLWGGGAGPLGHGKSHQAYRSPPGPTRGVSLFPSFTMGPPPHSPPPPSAPATLCSWGRLALFPGWMAQSLGRPHPRLTVC